MNGRGIKRNNNDREIGGKNDNDWEIGGEMIEI